MKIGASAALVGVANDAHVARLVSVIRSDIAVLPSLAAPYGITRRARNSPNTRKNIASLFTTSANPACRSLLVEEITS
jgi:hypothetical protein